MVAADVGAGCPVADGGCAGDQLDSVASALKCWLGAGAGAERGCGGGAAYCCSKRAPAAGLPCGVRSIPFCTRCGPVAAGVAGICVVTSVARSGGAADVCVGGGAAEV